MLTDNIDIRIRPLEDYSELTMLHELQARVWGMPPLIVIPNHFLLLIASTGGQILGAFCGGNELIGFSLAIVSRDSSGETYLSSHMLGVDPGFQSKSIGYALKQEQRRLAREAGYSRICWTYDPMETKNANLNIRKLGGVVREYKRSYYGNLETALSKGLPSDRYLVTLPLNEPTPRFLSTVPSKVALRAEASTNEFPTPRIAEIDLSQKEMKVLLQVPSNFQTLKSVDINRAHDWLMAVRTVSEKLFESGFEITEFNFVSESSVAEYCFAPRRAD